MQGAVQLGGCMNFDEQFHLIRGRGPEFAELRVGKRGDDKQKTSASSRAFPTLHAFENESLAQDGIWMDLRARGDFSACTEKSPSVKTESARLRGFERRGSARIEWLAKDSA